MPGYTQRLQGKDRLRRIHRIRTFSLLALVGVGAVLILGGFFAEGASLKPLFLPLPEALATGLIIAVGATCLDLYFRHLELKYAAGDSQRFLLAKESMGRSGWLSWVALAFAVILLIPSAAQLSGDLVTEPPMPFTVAGRTTTVVNFSSPDPMGVSFVGRILLTGQPSSLGDVRVTLARAGMPVTVGWVNRTQRLVLNLDPDQAALYAAWSLSLENTANGAASLAVVLEKEMIPVLFTFVPFLLILLGAANVGWWIRARPIRERTRSASVYAGGVETAATQDERFYVEYAKNPAKDEIPIEVPAVPRKGPTPSAQPAQPVPAAVAPAAPVAAAKVEPPKPSEKPTRPKADTPESLVSKGKALLAAGQPEAALAAFDEALRLNGSHVYALLGRAGCLERLGKSQDAIASYRKVLTADRKNEQALRTLAGLLISDHRWREALEVVDESLRSRPHDAATLDLRGDVLTNLGRRPEALGAYEAALALDPADENLRQKIEEVRVDVPGLLSRALIASASGNYTQALRLFDDILEVEPGNVNALIGKAVAYRRSGKALGAINCLDLVLGIQPGNVAALLNRGRILESEGDLEGALEAFDSLVSLSSLDDEAWAAQGDVLSKMGRDDDALRAYAEALKLNPGDELIQAKVREFEEARATGTGVLGELMEVKGIGEARAQALIDAGYRRSEDLAFASVEELMKVRGITKKIAQDLVSHFVLQVETL